MKVIIITLLLISSQIIYPLNNSSQSQKSKEEKRNLFLYSNMGFLDFISLGLGYQVTDNMAISVKGSQTFIGGNSFIFPNAGAGLGFKFNYFTSFLLFNSISLEYIAYLDVTIDKTLLTNSFKGNYYDLNIGHENIYDEGLNFFWALGLCVSQVKTLQTLYSPSIKIGLNYNFR